MKSENDLTRKEGCTILALVGLVFSVPSWLWQGWLGTFVWRWFAVSLFGARPLTTVQAIGVIIALHYFLPTQVRQFDKDRPNAEQVAESIATAVAYCFLIPLYMFLAAATVHWWMVR